MFPEFSPQLNNIQNTKTTLGKSFLFDFDKGDFVVKDGKLVAAENIEALKIWVEKILRTEKFKFKIYKKDTKREYGITLQDLIVGYDYPKQFIEAEIKREVTEALLKHPLVSSLDNWSIEKNNPILKISFKVVLKDGNTFNEEVNL